MLKSKWLFRNFTPAEMGCRCGKCDCGKSGLKMNWHFMDCLQMARVYAKVPFIIASGYRCKKYNNSIDGASKTSEHCNGLGVDIRFENTRELMRLVFGLIFGGFKRIKIYKQHDGKNGWVHVDSTKNKSKPKEWFEIKEV